MNLYAEWLEAKEAERRAVEVRRELEDKLIALYELSDQDEGSKTIKAPGYKVRVTQRFNRTVDSDLVQVIAAEYGLANHLSSLFRWKPEINMRAWKAADESITGPLSAAITTKPGRPSFSIETIEE
jgi:hypothetical protein